MTSGGAWPSPEGLDGSSRQPTELGGGRTRKGGGGGGAEGGPVRGRQDPD